MTISPSSRLLQPRSSWCNRTFNRNRESGGNGTEQSAGIVGLALSEPRSVRYPGVDKMANRLKWLVVLLGAALPLCAATPGSISGMVKSADGTPQMGALVEVFAAGTLQPFVAFTSQTGSFQVSRLVPGSYRIKVSAA